MKKWITWPSRPEAENNTGEPVSMCQTFVKIKLVIFKTVDLKQGTFTKHINLTTAKVPCFEST